MKKTILLYLLLFLLSFGCSNNSGNNQGQSSILSKKLVESFVKGPKDIQPEGTFISEGNPLYIISLTFKGKKTLVIRMGSDGFVMDLPTMYEKDEEFIHVKYDGDDFLFEIISEDTIKGEGLVEGLYIR